MRTRMRRRGKSAGTSLSSQGRAKGRKRRQGRSWQLWDMGPSRSICRIYNLLEKPTPKQCYVRRDSILSSFLLSGSGNNSSRGGRVTYTQHRSWCNLSVVTQIVLFLIFPFRMSVTFDFSCIHSSLLHSGVLDTGANGLHFNPGQRVSSQRQSPLLKNVKWKKESRKDQWSEESKW